MAEAVVSIALETFRDLLLEEGRFLSGVGDQVKELESQLKEIRCFLKDADRRRHEKDTIFNYIVEIRDLAYRAEDAIEAHAARVSSRRRRGLKHLIRRCSSILQQCYSLHQLGSEISQIKSGIESFTDKLRDYGIHRDGGESSAANNNQNWSRKTYPDFEIGECFVGMEDELKQLISLLRDKDHRVISIWGMGGSGKTTIARKVYNHMKETTNKSCDHFESFAWVCISQQCQIRSVLEDLLSQLRPQKNENVSTSLSDTVLMEQLCDIQREKRCLIVVDDIWETSHWDGLKHAFLVDDLKSKILVTTREREVAKVNNAFPVELGLLNVNNALELLENKAFTHTNIPDHKEKVETIGKEKLEQIQKEMVWKCGYLPLAISILGGVLSTRTDWEFVNENISTFMYKRQGDNKKEDEIDGVLNLSYESLPYYLKPCFLFLGILKEDESIDTDDLYAAWIAQGMIAYGIRDSGETLTDMAELYLSELASRSIVIVETDVNVNTSRRKYTSCKLHDVIRELCINMGKMEKFGLQNLVYEGGKFSSLLLQEASSSDIKVRHLAIHVNKEVEPEDDEVTIICEHLRSLRISNDPNRAVFEFPPQKIVDFHKFKLLRDLVIVRFKFAGRKLPRGITSLVHLRCLRLQECELDELPSSIANLVYLDTLDLFSSENIKVPNVLKKMLRLKNLILPDYDADEIGNYRLRLDEGVDKLESLMWLDSRVHELKCMGRMENLQQLVASIYDNESLSAITDAIATKWNKLVYSAVVIKEGCELATNEGGLLKKALTCPNLHILVIEIKLGKMLEVCRRSDFTSSRLTSLILAESEIEDDPMGVLGSLPCLRQLSLYQSFVGEEMTCPSPSFPRLEKLLLLGLPNLKEWRVEAGAMPLLSELQIVNCKRLEMLPHGLSGISTLKKLKISFMPRGFVERVLPSGDDFYKVSHASLTQSNNH